MIKLSEKQNEEINFENWEDEVYFYDRKDWVGLLDLQKRRAEEKPTDLHRQEGYAIALNLNKKYEDTLKLIEPIYRKHPIFCINEIMEALLGLNKTEDDFNWVTKPKTLKLDEETVTLCVKYLKGKRKPRSVSDICTELFLKADFLYFDEQTLAKYLSKFTNLFDLLGNASDYWNMQIKLKRKKR